MTTIARSSSLGALPAHRGASLNSAKKPTIRFCPSGVSMLRPTRRRPDADATHSFLYTMVLEKEPVDEDEPRSKQTADLSTGGGSSSSKAKAPSRRESGEKRSASATFADGAAGSGDGADAAASAAASARSTPRPTPTQSRDQSRKASQETACLHPVHHVESSGPAGSSSPMSADVRHHREMIELERERQAYVSQICGDSSRLDVSDWIGRIFTQEREQNLALEAQMQVEDRRRRRRGGTSDSGTHESGTTLLTNAGRSVCTAISRKVPSLVSDESLVVHHGQGLELLSAQERLSAYLAGEIPELKAHVDRCVAKRSDELRQQIDNDGAQHFLRQAHKREVFGSQANFLRWQNTRRATLQKELDERMPQWVWEAVQNWDQRGAMEAREAEVSETDLIFDYLTKRAAHINTSKLATEIPVLKAMHASYMMPAMWRDKYI